MSSTLLGGLLIFPSIALSALLVFLLRSSTSRREQLNLETCKARLEEIGAELKRGELSEAEADAARLALLSRPSSFRWRFAQGQRGTARTLILPAAGFLLVAGIGAATSYVRGFPESTGSGDAISSLPSHSGSEDEALQGLADYTRSIDTDKPVSMTAGKQLPDVNTMIERLAARLETAPEDIKGWRMLGWSYFQMGHYEQAATAYAKAVELDPSSAELKVSYEEAKAKASENGNPEMAASLRTTAAGKGGDGAEKTPMPEAMPPGERDAKIRSMVDGLAHRLESSPRDLEGWTRLMRSRVVLGEKEAAATAFRKALEIFKDDSTASGQITAAATELGLKAE